MFFFEMAGFRRVLAAGCVGWRAEGEAGVNFDIWITVFRDGNVAWVPMESILERFVPYVSQAEDDWYPLRFGQQQASGGLSLHPRDDCCVPGLSIERPPEDLAFWQIIAGILRDFPCVLYWPSTIKTFCMGKAELLPHLPKDFIESCGIPVVSTDAAYIRDWIGAHS
jgi:hypothetical protein